MTSTEQPAKSQACVPCAKRKVRCDRGEPCSNCKRRKQDHCAYPSLTPAERVKQLEALVKNIRQESECSELGVGHAQPETAKQRSSQVDVQPNQNDEKARNTASSIIVEEDGRVLYLESSSFHSWDRRNCRSFMSRTLAHEKDPRKASAPRGYDALQSLISHNEKLDLATRYPTQEMSDALWNAFQRNVHPLLKISFDWELESLRTASASPERQRQFSPREHAFMFALYLISATSLSEEDSMELFIRTRSSLLADFQLLCEQALAKADFFATSDFMTLQASAMYMTAGGLSSRINTRSLRLLMGLVIRHAERLGLHRDGSFMSLLPAETERRRRLWWYLQHIDMAFGVATGVVSLTLMADWDVKLPLNIEDVDINAEMSEPPPERKGLTSMSFVLWTYWVLNRQRSFRRTDGSKFGFTWMCDRSLPQTTRERMIDELESDINTRFLQHCDPIRPLDTLLQISARSFPWGMRRLLLHSQIQGNEIDDNDKHNSALLDLCIRCLDYDVNMHSQQSLRPWIWRTKAYFPWNAFVYVVAQASRPHNHATVERIWNLLSEVYSANSSLWTFEDDRRKPRAAELIIAAWKAQEARLLGTTRPSHNYQKPALVASLETMMLAGGPVEVDTDDQTAQDSTDTGPGFPLRSQTDHTTRSQNALESASDLENAANLSLDLDALFDPALGDIDWSFWGSWD